MNSTITNLLAEKSQNFSHKIPILAFKVIQGHRIQRQSRASVQLHISD